MQIFFLLKAMSKAVTREDNLRIQKVGIHLEFQLI